MRNYLFELALKYTKIAQCNYLANNGLKLLRKIGSLLYYEKLYGPTLNI